MVRRVRAFGLIELLVVTGVIAIVLAIAMPALSRAREEGRRTQCLAQTRSHCQLISAYAIDYDGELPFIWHETREPPELPYEIPRGNADWYLAATGLWHLRLWEEFGGDPLHESLFCPGNPQHPSDYEAAGKRLGLSRDQVRTTIDYRLSSALLLDPMALNPKQPRIVPRFYVPRKIAEVVFPGEKVFLIDDVPYHDPKWRRTGMHTMPFERIVSFGDGSAVCANSGGFTDGLIMNSSGYATRDHLQAQANSLHFTPWGVRGRDRQ